MTVEDLAWTVEEACQNACPSPKQILLDGWLLRASGGETRRTNSVNPLRSGPRDPTSIIKAAEVIYRSLGQAAIFRVPSIVPEMEGPLERRGYNAEGETCTLLTDFTDHRSVDLQDVELLDDPSDEWYAAWAALNGASALVRRIYKERMDCIFLPKAFVSCRIDGDLVAVAYGIIHKGLLVVESVGTHRNYRRRGYAARALRRLMDWAKRQGAHGGCLQVEAENAPARALYRSLRFDRELYRYHYRRKIMAG
ncbi:GNAT family N-acetyltransferase [Beijerinckia indica]|uniref:GCN5-related N-acetyltransferase n=1 Tax=Beijerinckia indica subsp. indica (strain ATCC 9039 / DSM 1715 / NCIMB 8712) TaxID=395963 RepID=B2IDW1_BEII9|nr:GNAT family N-acetyltransferase [Beijerinckia indica]ACB96893.1 GCN5-related N-acetyltransferase [Beijerinckia indica subsp. indica ATCC 9039]